MRQCAQRATCSCTCLALALGHIRRLLDCIAINYIAAFPAQAVPPERHRAALHCRSRRHRSLAPAKRLASYACNEKALRAAQPEHPPLLLLLLVLKLRGNRTASRGFRRIFETTRTCDNGFSQCGIEVATVPLPPAAYRCRRRRWGRERQCSPVTALAVSNGRHWRFQSGLVLWPCRRGSGTNSLPTLQRVPTADCEVFPSQRHSKVKSNKTHKAVRAAATYTHTCMHACMHTCLPALPCIAQGSVGVRKEGRVLSDGCGWVNIFIAGWVSIQSCATVQRLHHFQGAGVRGCRGARVPGCGGAGVQRCRSPKVQGARVLNCEGAGCVITGARRHAVPCPAVVLGACHAFGKRRGDDRAQKDTTGVVGGAGWPQSDAAAVLGAACWVPSASQPATPPGTTGAACMLCPCCRALRTATGAEARPTSSTSLAPVLPDTAAIVAPGKRGAMVV